MIGLPNRSTINFEKQPEFQSCFESGYDPTRVLRRIEALAGQRLTIGKTLLFLDEVQLCSEAIVSLRYFFEEMPDLHIIAAGSLLEFAIETISIPVGRVTFRHLGPMSFEEFLHNSGNQVLLDEIRGHSVRLPFPEALHTRAISLLKEYLAMIYLIKPILLNSYSKLAESLWGLIITHNVSNFCSLTSTLCKELVIST